jgi:hypothetical protein
MSSLFRAQRYELAFPTAPALIEAAIVVEIYGISESPPFTRLCSDSLQRFRTQPRLGELPQAVRLFTIPIGNPEVLAAIVVVGNTAAEANTSEHAIPTNTLKADRKPLSDLSEDMVVIPHILKPVASCMPKDEIGHRLSDTAQSI